MYFIQLYEKLLGIYVCNYKGVKKVYIKCKYANKSYKYIYYTMYLGKYIVIGYFNEWIISDKGINTLPMIKKDKDTSKILKSASIMISYIYNILDLMPNIFSYTLFVLYFY